MSIFKCCGGKDNQTYQVQRYENGELKTQYVNNIKKLRNANMDQTVLRVQKSQYNDLMKKHKGDKKFTDQSFPPGSRSLGNIDEVPVDCDWKRISEIFHNPKLFVSGVDPTDVVQGTLGDCYLLSALAALSEEDRRIESVFGSQEFHPNGLYKVTLRIDGIIQQIVVDDFIPINKANKPLFCQPKGNQFWVVILEKAWAKAHGSYANIASGTPTEVFKAVTYAPSELKPIKDSEEQRMRLWDKILDHARRNDPCCAGSKRTGQINWQSIGLTSNHAYTLLNAAQLTDENGSPQRMLKLRNPWGQNQWSGQGSQNDHGFWSRIESSQHKDRFLQQQKKSNDGIFYMKYEDFCQHFSEVHFCNLLESPKYEIQKLYSDKKHGTIYNFKIDKPDVYALELHQSGMRGQGQERQKQGLNRSTLLLARGEDYQFIDGSLKYNDQDNSLRVKLDPGNYYIFAKIDPTITKGELPEEMSVSCYSNNFVDLIPADRKKHPDFFKKVFLSYARNHRRKQYDDGKMWISWKLFYEKGGYAYIAFGVDPSSTKKFIIGFDEKQFQNMNYILKKPFKGQGNQHFQVKPGEQQIIVSRVRNSQPTSMKFPPPFDIKIDRH